MKKLILLLITIASLSGCAKEVVEVEKQQSEIINPLSVSINYGYTTPVHAVLAEMNKSLSLTDKESICSMPTVSGKVKLYVYLPLNTNTELLFKYNNITRSIFIIKSETIYVTYSLYKLNLALFDNGGTNW